jgi:hypothetical protein
VFNFLLDPFFPIGTNTLGLVMIFAAYYAALTVEAMLPRVERGVLDMVCGVTCFTLDMGLRKVLKHESLLEGDRGGLFVYLPFWMWGLVAIFVGAGKVVWALLT